MKQPKDGERGSVPSRSRGRRGPGSPARAGRGGGGEGGAQPCPVPLPTPSLWGAGTRGGDTLVAEGTPPVRAKQAGAGGTRSMLGTREGHVPAWRRWETRGCGGTSPVLGGGRGRGGHPHGHPSPSPTPWGFVPSPLQPRGALSLPGGPHSAAPPACVTPPSQGLLFSRWGKDGARRAGQGLGTLAGSGAGGAGWGPAQGPGVRMGSRDPHWLSLSRAQCRGLGDSGARAEPSGVRVDRGWQGGGRCPDGSCQALGLSLLGRGVPSPCRGPAGTEGRGGCSALLHAAHT